MPSMNYERCHPQSKSAWNSRYYYIAENCGLTGELLRTAAFITLLIGLTQATQAQQSGRSTTKSGDAGTRGGTPAYTFKPVGNADLPASIRIGGLQLVEFGLGAPITLSESGSVLYFATTEKGETAFVDKEPVAYVGRQIDNKTLKTVGRAVMNKKGDYWFYGAFEGGAGIVFKDHFVLTTGQTLDDGCVISQFPTDLYLSPEGLYTVSVGCKGTGHGSGPIADIVVDGKPSRNAAHAVPDWIPRVASGAHAYNNQHQYVSVTAGSSVETLEHKSLLSSSQNVAQAVAMNERGQVLTADPMIFNYTDATDQPHTLADAEYYARLLDLSSLKQFGMVPYRYEHGKAIYGVAVSFGYPFLAINNSGQIAFFVRYLKEGAKTPGIALIVGKPSGNTHPGCNTSQSAEPHTVLNAGEAKVLYTCPRNEYSIDLGRANCFGYALGGKEYYGGIYNTGTAIADILRFQFDDVTGSPIHPGDRIVYILPAEQTEGKKATYNHAEVVYSVADNITNPTDPSVIVDAREGGDTLRHPDESPLANRYHGPANRDCCLTTEYRVYRLKLCQCNSDGSN